MPMTPRHALRFAANLSWLYTELPFLDRFAAAAEDGFKGVECLFPHEHPTDAVRARLNDAGLSLVLFNAAPGQWSAGDRGLACLAHREAEFQQSVRNALALAQELQCPRVHIMAGISQGVLTGDAAVLASEWALYAQRLAWAAQQARQAGVTVMIEPINPIDMPGYLLQRQADAHRLVQDIGLPSLQVQMDIYHCQRVERQALALLSDLLPSGRVGHLQLAGVPERHEPDSGELDYAQVFQHLAQAGYAGWIGCEYRPRDAQPGGTRRGLGWLRALHSTD